jgi:hypothetical protein
MAASISPVTLLLFPRDDLAFDSYAKRLAEATRDPDTAERWLRVRYPRAAIHARDPLGTLLGQNVAWYVYRDGSPTAEAS